MKASNGFSYMIPSFLLLAIAACSSPVVTREPEILQEREYEQTAGKPILNPANGHYYEVVIEDINWDDAKAAAESRTFKDLRGHLATITSQDENEFLVNILPSTITHPSSGINLWVGCFQPAGSPEPDGDWQWVTGEPIVYQNWAPDEPNNAPYGNSPNEDNLEIRQHGEWNDAPGMYDAAGYIVEYESSIVF